MRWRRGYLDEIVGCWVFVLEDLRVASCVSSVSCRGAIAVVRRDIVEISVPGSEPVGS
jgi:hypothetical protein